MLVPCGLFPDMEDNFQDGNSLGGDFDLVFRQIFTTYLLQKYLGIPSVFLTFRSCCHLTVSHLM